MFLNEQNTDVEGRIKKVGWKANLIGHVNSRYFFEKTLGARATLIL